MRSKSTLSAVIVLAVLLLFGGICIGVAAKNFPGITYKNEIDLFGALTFLVTLGIGVAFPFLIKKWIDDNTFIKQFLVRETEILEGIYSENKQILDDCIKRRSVTQSDMQKVSFVFFRADLQIESIAKQLDISFPGNEKILWGLLMAYNDYYDFLTGGNFMKSGFTINHRFYEVHTVELNKVSMKTKELIHNVFKL